MKPLALILVSLWFAGSPGDSTASERSICLQGPRPFDLETAVLRRCVTGRDGRLQFSSRLAKTRPLETGTTNSSPTTAHSESPGLSSRGALPRHTNAAPASVDAEELDREITKTLTRPEFAWRMPRNQNPDDVAASAFWTSFSDWLERMMKQVRDWLRSFMEWLRGFFEVEDHDSSYDFDWTKGIKALLFLLLAVAACTLGILAYRTWKRRRYRAMPATAFAPDEVPDLHDEAVTASQLPPNEWLELARELLGRGERRLAIRALFLGALAHLAHRELVTVAVYKSNREYLRELMRRAHDRPSLLEAFRANMRLLEDVWYGTSEATEVLVQTFLSHNEAIVGDAPAADDTGGAA